MMAELTEADPTPLTAPTPPPHLPIFKVTRDILLVGDAWAFGTSSLELLNADTKRTAAVIGSKRQELSAEGKSIVPMRGVKEGPARLITTAGHGTTMCISTLNNMLAKEQLRSGNGLFVIPDSRRKERLLYGSGRLTLGSTGVKLGSIGHDDHYNPRVDTCLEAFIRVITAAAEAQLSAQ